MIPIKELAHKERDLIVSLRRHFHEYPELSHNEFTTMDYIEARLHEWNIPTVRVPQGGIIATVDSGKPGWTALVRADIDALAIQEKENNLSSKKVVLSKTDGDMHACGHDGHMAMALTEAKILSDHKDAWTGKVLFVFEQAEEIGERGVSQILRYLHDHNIHVGYGLYHTCYVASSCRQGRHCLRYGYGRCLFLQRYLTRLRWARLSSRHG